MAPAQFTRYSLKSRRPSTSRRLPKSCLPPQSGRPLRERCRIKAPLEIWSYREWETMHYDGNIQLVFEEEDSPVEPTPPPLPTPLLIESHMMELMPGLTIALVDEERDIHALRTLGGDLFTHVVQLRYVVPSVGKKGGPSMSFRRSEEAPRNARMQHLKLNCLANSRWMRPKRTAVGPKELLAARDFLSLALPLGKTKWMPGPDELPVDEEDDQNTWNVQSLRAQGGKDEDEDPNVQCVFPANNERLNNLTKYLDSCVSPSPEEETQVLIVAPHRGASDVLAILYCYFALVDDAMFRELIETDLPDDVWRRADVLAPGAMEYVKRIAKRG